MHARANGQGRAEVFPEFAGDLLAVSQVHTDAPNAAQGRGGGERERHRRRVVVLQSQRGERGTVEPRSALVDRDLRVGHLREHRDGVRNHLIGAGGGFHAAKIRIISGAHVHLAHVAGQYNRLGVHRGRPLKNQVDFVLADEARRVSKLSGHQGAPGETRAEHANHGTRVPSATAGNHVVNRQFVPHGDGGRTILNERQGLAQRVSKRSRAQSDQRLRAQRRRRADVRGNREDRIIHHRAVVGRRGKIADAEAAVAVARHAECVAQRTRDGDAEEAVEGPVVIGERLGAGHDGPRLGEAELELDGATRRHSFVSNFNLHGQRLTGRGRGKPES